MRQALLISGAFIVAAATLAPREVNAGCRSCAVVYPYAGAYYNYAPGYFYAPIQGCYWRKVRHWDWDGQYWLVSRVQVCG
jgi:hypothetical protein